MERKTIDYSFVMFKNIFAIVLVFVLAMTSECRHQFYSNNGQGGYTQRFRIRFVRPAGLGGMGQSGMMGGMGQNQMEGMGFGRRF